MLCARAQSKKLENGSKIRNNNVVEKLAIQSGCLKKASKRITDDGYDSEDILYNYSRFTSRSGR
uniref:Transposase n=1 Tax=Romanomermis culicivorax TaxID=13658 RepID=A0A915IF33_ROMCU